MGISESEERLREYIEKDIIYQDYKKSNKEPSDFERFCFVHCRDIENVLDENQQLKKANEILKENAIHNDKVVDDTNWKIKQYKSVLDEIREFTDNHIMLIYTKNAPREMVGMKELLQILDKVKE